MSRTHVPSTMVLALLAGLAGCAGRGSETPVAEGPKPPATPQAQPARFNPFAVSGAGLLANRPIDISGPSRVASAKGAAVPPPPPKPASGTFRKAEEPAIALNPKPPAPEASNSATAFYGQVMSHAMNPSADATARGGGVNVSQVSFASEGADFDPNISRDGTKIVFASTQHRPTADLYIKDVNGRTVTQLTTDPANDIMPAISPDGTRIAFTSNRAGTWNIFVMPITGGRAIQITSTSADDLHPSWSPDGAQLVFSRLGAMSGQWEMWITDVSGTGASKFIGYGLFPQWSPVRGTGPLGGDLIAFQRSRERGDRSFGVWTLEYKDGQAGNATEIASSPSSACINPTWSPDGQWLAFSTVPSAAEWAGQIDARPTQADLWMVDLGGGSRINLTSGLALNLMPTFGPQNRLFFVSDRGGVDNLWSMDTSAVVKLAALNAQGRTGPAVAGKPGRDAHTDHAPAVSTAPTGEHAEGEDHR